jgi:hypothetical protein
LELPQVPITGKDLWLLSVPLHWCCLSFLFSPLQLLLPPHCHFYNKIDKKQKQKLKIIHSNKAIVIKFSVSVSVVTFKEINIASQWPDSFYVYLDMLISVPRYSHVPPYKNTGGYSLRPAG